MLMENRIGIIERDETLSAALQDFLMEEGYDTKVLSWSLLEGPLKLNSFVEAHEFKCTLIDVPIPYKEHAMFFNAYIKNGVHLGRRVIFMSTNKKLLADEFPLLKPILTKPFDLKELL